ERIRPGRIRSGRIRPGRIRSGGTRPRGIHGPRLQVRRRSRNDLRGYRPAAIGRAGSRGQRPEVGRGTLEDVMTTPSTDLARETVDRYVDSWNGRMSGEGAATDQVRYVAPVGVLSGPEALREFRPRFLGHVGASAEFRPTGEPDLHHD